MEPEDSIQQKLDESRARIEEALALMEKMSKLRALLLIKKGAGGRYLQHAQPDLEQLKKAEQAILADYQSKKPSVKKRKKSNLVQTMSRRGMA